MSELDVAKEQIAYLKVWLGILVVTEISVFGWLLANIGNATPVLLWGAIIALIGLTGSILALHERIERRIQSLRDL